jgi:hypothetical protein
VRAERVPDTVAYRPLPLGWRFLVVIEATVGGLLTAMGALPLVMATVTLLSPRPDPHGLALFGLGALVFVPLGAALVLAAVSLWNRWRHWRKLQLVPLVVAAVLIAIV